MPNTRGYTDSWKVFPKFEESGSDVNHSIGKTKDINGSCRQKSQPKGNTWYELFYHQGRK
jgi:hypothetical protein